MTGLIITHVMLFLRKSVYCRTAYVKNKLQRLELSADEIQAFMNIWTTVENQLQSFTGKRFPKIDFFLYIKF